MLSMNCKLFYCLNSCSKLFQSSAIHKINDIKTRAFSCLQQKLNMFTSTCKFLCRLKKVFLLNYSVLSSLSTLVNFDSFVRVYSENVGIQQVRETNVLRDNAFHESNLRITKLLQN